jgi:cleavage and polyadenylation specificity factor subunit 3
VTSSNETLKKRVEGVLDMALTTISSLSESFMSGAPVIAEDVGLSQKQDQIASPKELKLA